MAGIKIKKNVKITWTRRLMISAINFLRRGRYSRIIVAGAAAAVIIAVVLVIVLTGSTSPRDMADVNEEGVSCYLIKPMTIDEMNRTSRMLKDIFSGMRSCDAP
jgi:DNA-binding NarL/FixJ family response regulator